MTLKDHCSYKISQLFVTFKSSDEEGNEILAHWRSTFGNNIFDYRRPYDKTNSIPKFETILSQCPSVLEQRHDIIDCKLYSRENNNSYNRERDKFTIETSKYDGHYP